MLPATDMEIALAWLGSVAPDVPPAMQEDYDRLVQAVGAFRSFDRLPRAIIHNDCHPGNAIVTPDGSIVLIDWNGAGLGPPVVDLGFLLISCEIAPSWSTPVIPGPDRVRAIVQGYARQRTPDPAELDWLPDAMRFRSLLYGATHLAKSAEQGLSTLPKTWWWQRYQMAEHVAARASEHFNRLS